MKQVPQFDGGKTVKLLLSGCQNRADLASPSCLCGRIKSLCYLIKMTPIAITGQPNPISFKLVHPEDPEKAGVSVLLAIEESHLAFHSWSEEKALRVVIDSCKDFDTDVVVDHLCWMFHPRKIQIWDDPSENKKKEGKGIWEWPIILVLLFFFWFLVSGFCSLLQRAVSWLF